MDDAASLAIAEARILTTRGDSVLGLCCGWCCWRLICWNCRIRSWTLGRLLVSAWFGGDLVIGWMKKGWVAGLVAGGLGLFVFTMRMLVAYGC